MKEIALVLPHQLFHKNPILSKDRTIVLLEHPRYFTDFNFHKLKLVLHRASMQHYYTFLKEKNYGVNYIEYHEVKKYLSALKKDTTVHVIDPVDHDLANELQTIFKKRAIIAVWYESPMFLTPTDWIKEHMSTKKKFLMHSFYMAQRKRLNILVKNNKPIGGKWSFDTQNRNRIPDSVKIPSIQPIAISSIVKTAQRYIQKHFPNNPGTVLTFIYPVTTAQAKKWFATFLKQRFTHFGTYQDAMKQGESFLFHSVLSALLNIGLLTPDYVIDQTLSYSKNNTIALNNVEGFIRQIIGWREFVRAVYHLHGQKQKKSNFFGNKNKLPNPFYHATTGIDPVDDSIKKLINTAYSHHIERLMVLGNSMLLLEIKPDDVYEWFMELYIDSYDWVMIPNIYGMSQYADTSMTTKPYIAGSNYILTMSDYKKGAWCDIWNALLWTFIKKHYKKLASIARMRFLINAFNKKTEDEMKHYEHIAKEFKKKLKR